MTAALEQARAEVDEVALVEAALAAGVAEAFRRASAASERPPHRFSMSGLGGCTRQGAYKLAMTPVDDPPPPVRENRAAMIGKWIHEGLLPWLVEVFGGAWMEQPVVLYAAGVEVVDDGPGWRLVETDGTYDLLVVLLLPDGTILVVVDLKTTAERKLAAVRRRGVYAEHRMQVRGYGAALWQAGVPVRHVAYLYLDRSTGDVEPIVEPFTNDALMAPILRVAEVRAHADLGPDTAPRQTAAGRRMRGPGLDIECDTCPWLARCWPGAERGRVGAQTALARVDGGVEAAAELLADAHDRAAVAERDKALAKAILADTDAGLYGPWLVEWMGGGLRPDAKAAEALLAGYGEPMPKRAVRQYARVTPRTRLNRRQEAEWAGSLAEVDIPDREAADDD